MNTFQYSYRASVVNVCHAHGENVLIFENLQLLLLFFPLATYKFIKLYIIKALSLSFVKCTLLR